MKKQVDFSLNLLSINYLLKMTYQTSSKRGLPFFSTFLLFTLIILEAEAQVGANWTRHDDIRTGRKVMVNSIFTSSNIPSLLSYNISYSSALTGTTNAGIGITGFETFITNDFSINTTIQNFTASWMRISVGVYGDTVATHIAVNWIAVGDTVDFLQVMFDCFLCDTLSVNNNTRTETRTATTFFQGYVNLTATVYLAGFQVHNSQGITNYLSASADIASGTNVIDFSFTTNENNTVTSICYTTLIFCQEITEIYWQNWGVMGQEQLTQAITPAVFNPRARYERRDGMFFGISAFNVSRARIRLFDMDTDDDYQNLQNNYQTNVGTYSIMMDYFWMAVRHCDSEGNGGQQRWFVVQDQTCVNNNNCPGDTVETDPGRFCHGCHYTCLDCNGAHEQNCTTCDPTNFRVNQTTADGQCPCSERYIDVGVSLCYPCQYYMPGCQTCSSTTLCTDCFSGFILQSSGICGCTTGFLVSGICTNITGCTSAVEYGGTIYCTECNSTLNFQRNTDFSCECAPAYYGSVDQVCLSACGDGLQAANEGCDDGNTNNGDGCSSSCAVEDNWVCFNGTVTTSSVCLIDNSFSMKVKYVRRILTGNIMQVGIDISPVVEQFNSINFKEFLTHNVPSTNYNVSYSNGRLILQFEYNRTIEGEDFLVTFAFNPDYFYNSSISVAIPASGMNAKLTYDSLSSANYPLQIIVIVLCVLAIVVLFVSAMSERMIGIEMIQTIQTCLFVQMVVKTMPASLAPLQNLQYSSGYNHIMGEDSARTYTFAFSLSSIGLQKQFLLSFNLMYIVLLLVILVCIVLKAKQIYHESKAEKVIDEYEEEKNEEKWQKVTKIFYFIFERILFVTGFMLMFLIIAAIMVQLTDMSADYSVMSKELNLLGGGIAMAIIACLICAVIINGIYPGTLIFPMLMKQYYPPIYFIYQSAFIFLLSFIYTQEYILYILGAMAVLFLIYNIMHRPYPEKIHTFVLVFHQLVIITVILLLIFEMRTTPTQHETMYVIAAYSIVAALYIVVFLNLYRVCRYRKFLKEKNWDQYGNQKVENTNIAMIQSGDGNYHPLQTPKRGSSIKNSDQQKRLKKEEREKKIKAKLQKSQYKKKNEKSQDKSKVKSKDKRKDSLIELDDIKKGSKGKDVKDDKDYKWKVNELADQERAKPTQRGVHPDSSRDKDQVFDYHKVQNGKEGDKNLNSTKTVKNLRLDDNEEEEDMRKKNNTSKNDKNNESKNIDETQNHYSPYDEHGFVNESYRKPRKGEEDEDEEEQIDPLKLIKMKLRQDFSNKLKGSTMREA